MVALLSMQTQCLSSLDLRAFLRSCHCFLQQDLTPDSWTAFQKLLLLSHRPDFGLYIRQLKKLPRSEQLKILDGFSNGQIESKLWLMETMDYVFPSQRLHIHVMGAWFGLLPRLLAWVLKERILKIHGYDIDADCIQQARFLNEPESYDGLMEFYNQDMMTIDYGHIIKSQNCMIINTSCEHLEHFERWFSMIPAGTPLVLQGNNYSEHEDHMVSWSSLAEFKSSAPLSFLLYEGVLDLPKYQRYMLIGLK